MCEVGRRTKATHVSEATTVAKKKKKKKEIKPNVATIFSRI